MVCGDGSAAFSRRFDDGSAALAFHVDSTNSVALMFFCDDVDGSR